MQAAWKRVIDFFFPIQSDEWLTILRIGLAIQVLLYCLSMRSDWTYLLAGTGRGLISRDLSEATLRREFVYSQIGLAGKNWKPFWPERSGNTGCGLALFTLCCLFPGRGTVQPNRRNLNVVFSSLRGQKWRPFGIWDG
jgi:hypothetical protein